MHIYPPYISIQVAATALALCYREARGQEAKDVLVAMETVVMATRAAAPMQLLHPIGRQCSALADGAECLLHAVILAVTGILKVWWKLPYMEKVE